MVEFDEENCTPQTGANPESIAIAAMKIAMRHQQCGLETLPARFREVTVP